MKLCENYKNDKGLNKILNKNNALREDCREDAKIIRKRYESDF